MSVNLNPEEFDRLDSSPIEPTTAPVAQKKPGAFRAFQHRNFRIFWIGQLISLIGTWMQNLAQGWLIVLLVDPNTINLLHHGGIAVGSAHQQLSPALEAKANLWSGWVNFAGGIPIVLLTLIAGVVADRVSKRGLLLVTQSILVMTAVGLGWLCVTGKVEIWHVIVFAVISGIATSFDMPTRQSFIVELVGREDVPSAVALNSSMFNAARALGPAIAGLLLAARVSIGAAFIGNGILTLAAIAALLLLRLPPRPIAAPQSASLGAIWGNMREGFQYVRTNQTVRNLVILVGSFGTFAFSFNILIPVFIRYTLLPNASDAYQVKAFGTMETVRGVGALCGALVVATLGSPTRQRNMLIGGALIATVFLLAFAVCRSLWLADLLMGIVSFGFVVCFATSNTLVQLTVPDQLRGRVMSIYTLMFLGTGPFGSLFAGWLATFISAWRTMLIFGGISLITALVMAFRPGGLRDIRVAQKPIG